jgi:electron transfer flavoprotein beta subunit
LNIVVCIKQVPDTATIRFEPGAERVDISGSTLIINPMDEYALEEGLRLREKYGGKVTAISLGTKETEETLRTAIALGIDEGILVSDPLFESSDTYVTAYVLGQAIKKLGSFHLILFGKSSSDSDTAWTGPAVAEFLGIPDVAFVKKIEEISESMARVQRMMEEGSDLIETSLPAVFTVVKEINEPRLPSLKGKLKAKSYKVPIWTATDLGIDSTQIGKARAKSQLLRIWVPEARKGGIVFQGEPEDVAAQLVEILKDQQIL